MSKLGKAVCKWKNNNQAPSSSPLLLTSGLSRVTCPPASFPLFSWEARGDRHMQWEVVLTPLCCLFIVICETVNCARIYITWLLTRVFWNISIFVSETITSLRMYGRTLNHFYFVEICQGLNYCNNLLMGLPASVWSCSHLSSALLPEGTF